MQTLVIRKPIPPALLTAILRQLAEAAEAGADCPVTVQST